MNLVTGQAILKVILSRVDLCERRTILMKALHHQINNLKEEDAVGQCVSMDGGQARWGDPGSKEMLSGK